MPAFISFAFMLEDGQELLRGTEIEFDLFTELRTLFLDHYPTGQVRRLGLTRIGRKEWEDSQGVSAKDSSPESAKKDTTNKATSSENNTKQKSQPPTGSTSVTTQ